MLRVILLQISYRPHMLHLILHIISYHSFRVNRFIFPKVDLALHHAFFRLHFNIDLGHGDQLRCVALIILKSLINFILAFLLRLFVVLSEEISVYQGL